MITTGTSKAVRRLIDSGIIPPNCRKAILKLEAQSVITLELELFVSKEQFDEIANALIDNADEANRLARSVVFINGAERTPEIHLD